MDQEARRAVAGAFTFLVPYQAVRREAPANPKTVEPRLSASRDSKPETPQLCVPTGNHLALLYLGTCSALCFISVLRSRLTILPQTTMVVLAGRIINRKIVLWAPGRMSRLHVPKGPTDASRPTPRLLLWFPTRHRPALSARDEPGGRAAVSSKGRVGADRQRPLPGALPHSQALASGAYGAVSMACSLLTNPDLPPALSAGIEKPENPGTFCNSCTVRIPSSSRSIAIGRSWRR